LGMMLAVQFIVGQLNTPVNEIFSFIQSAQDAKISTERLAEIQDTTPEDTGEKLPVEEATFADLEFSNVSFAYPGTPNIAVLKNISFTIPRGSTTAIVGTSGSGKTTILKLLMKFYNPVSGTINYGHVDLRQLQSAGWRAKCGAVLQDGFMFNETLMKNIAIGEDQIDVTRVYSACEMANLTDFVRQLPLGFNTKFGVNGQGLSQGQKQRILIARAIYKNPNLLLFDEATNALDANNELQIMNNMASFFRKRTTVIVAHRLSTVKNADNIIVLEKGKIVENGTHLELVERRGAYYTLIQNQLELGN
ncbi:MAG: ATP-binding cassette domain-containing protein, partial [Bacteroidota bacterium]